MHAYAHVLQLQAENSTEQINVLAISSVNSDINIVISAHVRHLMNRWNLTKLELLEEHDLHMTDGQMKKYRTRFCFPIPPTPPAHTHTHTQQLKIAQCLFHNYSLFYSTDVIENIL